MKTPQQCIPILQTGRWFAKLPEPMVQAMLGMAKIRTLQAGEVLFLRNDPPCGLYALVQGGIRFSGLSSTSHDTREAVLAVLTPPAWFGEISVFDGSVRTHDAMALEPSTLLQVPHGDLTDWLHQHPMYWRTLAFLMADKLRMAFVSMEEQTVLPVAQRLARRLIVMSHDYGQGNVTSRSRRVLAVTQEQLAQMTGASRQTVNQILNDWKVRNIIRTQRAGLEIVDSVALQKEGL